MGLIDSLRGKVVGLDAAPLIYYIEEAAQLRAFHSIRTPDAIQMATAIAEKADFFLTNDKNLPSLPNLPLLIVDNIAVSETTEEES